MTDVFDNPIGLDAFEFVEFSAPEKGLLEPVFEKMGFTSIARHRSKDVQLWRQGGDQRDHQLRTRRAYNGEGIQHVAFAADDLYATWDHLNALGQAFTPAPPARYYEMLEKRLPGHREPLDQLLSRGLLLDGSTKAGDPRLLLQIFGRTVIGTVEFIQRKKDEGFGEGNFTALFKSLEMDQIGRGTRAVDKEPA